MKILVLNAGSSSQKSCLYEVKQVTLACDGHHTLLRDYSFAVPAAHQLQNSSQFA